VIHTVKLVDL